MRKTVLFLSLAALWCMATVATANPYASQVSISDSAFVHGTTTDVTISFMLNEPAETVDVQIIGPAPDTSVNRTITINNAPRGLNSVVWDGLMDNSAPAADGDYTVKVIASNGAGYGAWTNITPIGVYITEEWTQPVTELGVAAAANATRGIGYTGGNLVITGTTPRDIHIASAADGTFISDALLQGVDPYGFGHTSGNLDYDLWLGPYDVASNADGDIYIGHYRGGTFPLMQLDGLTTPVAVTAGTLCNNRAIDVVNTGANKILYLSDQGTLAAGQVRVFTTDSGTTFSLLEALPASPAGPNFTHTVIGREGNTGGDGDVIWGSRSGGNLERWVRSGGVWAQDTNFSSSLGTVTGGDYLVLGGQDYIAGVMYRYTPSTHQTIGIYNGDTGELVGEWDPADARINNGGNGDLTAVSTGANSADLYFIRDEHNDYGKLSVESGEIGSAQYWTPNGVAVVRDPASPNFGLVAVASGYPDLSANPGASTNKQGLYILNPDFTFAGGSEQASFDAAINDPLAPWDAGDSWSPWKVRTGRDDGKFYLGDWGTFNSTDNIYIYDLASTATAILQSGSGNHGRVLSCMTITSGSETLLYGIDRDGNATSSPPLMRWNVGSDVENHLGAATTVLPTPTTGLGFVAYSLADFTVDSEGNIYVLNARWGSADTLIFAFRPDPLPLTPANLIWAKTGVALGLADGTYPRSIDIDENAGVLYVYHRGIGQVKVHDMTTGDIVDSFTVGGASGSTSARNGTAVDYAGNVYTSNNSDEHVRMWSPPGASIVEVAVADAITMSNSPTPTSVDDWLIHE